MGWPFCIQVGRAPAAVGRGILAEPTMTRDLAIDLGSANTLVSERGRGVVLSEPTLVAIDERTGAVLAFGTEAWQKAAASPGRVVASRPLRHGAITDFDITEALIRIVFARVGVGRFTHPRVMISVSSAISTVERRALSDAAVAAGARVAHLIDEPMAAAIGAGLPIERPSGNCIIDVGGGTTEVAVVSMGGIIASRAVRVGGFEFDEAIVRWLRTHHGLSISERAAERLKIQLGSTALVGDESALEIRGREVATGAPRSATVGAEELRAAMEGCIGPVIDAVRGTLTDTPPELAHDVLERGMTLTGGGALMRGLAERIQVETSLAVHVADSPLETVCVGAARALASFDRLREQGALRA